MSLSINEAEDLAVTSSYIYGELMRDPSFFNHIDWAVEIAKAFINKFPTNTNWDEIGLNWEEELYNFYHEFIKK